MVARVTRARQSTVFAENYLAGAKERTLVLTVGLSAQLREGSDD